MLDAPNEEDEDGVVQLDDQVSEQEDRVPAKKVIGLAARIETV